MSSACVFRQARTVHRLPITDYVGRGICFRKTATVTPKVDKTYEFDFEKAVRSDKALHEHFKLDGTFTGPPTSKFHEEFQKKAKPPVKHDHAEDD